ncbi:MAG: hypothetical protein CBB76_08520 [Crocinitomicaceae bacterium TMED16]|nr:MAG: hypothetical protein CBB76_08520 [Crocinitomicaceae bacterium TMED16]
MENPIEHLDLGFVNFTKHPKNPSFLVYRFTDVERANSFRDELISNNITFEEDTEEKKQVTYTLFALHKKHYKKTMQMNFKVEGQHKKPLIPFRLLRWTVLLFGLGILILSILSYCKHMTYLNQQTEQLK